MQEQQAGQSVNVIVIACGDITKDLHLDITASVNEGIVSLVILMCAVRGTV